jgi:hypothetical protein
LVPKPKVNLTRFHGVFAPNSKHRVDVTPAKRGKGSTRHENEDKTPEQGHRRHDLGKAWKAAEAGGFNRKSGVLNHIEVG